MTPMYCEECGPDEKWSALYRVSKDGEPPRWRCLKHGGTLRRIDELERELARLKEIET